MGITSHPLTLRITRWIARGDGREAGEVLLDGRRVYILPTVPGLAFGAAVLALLVGSINYNLQLGFLLTFLVFSMAVVGMHSTHSNLVQLVLRGVRVEPVFAGDVAAFEIAVSNPGTLDRWALRFAFLQPGVPDRGSDGRARRPIVSAEVPALGLRNVKVPLPAPRRGRLPAPRIRIETRFPFGLWRAWAYLTPALEAIVYPRPEDDAPPLPATGSGSGDSTGMASSGADFAGVRPYQAGDSQRLIAWRLAARSDDLSVKQFEAGGAGDLVLEYGALPAALDVEKRLARLTRWVLDADAAHLRYGLRLPDANVAIGSGAVHREQCLVALALSKA